MSDAWMLYRRQPTRLYQVGRSKRRNGGNRYARDGRTLPSVRFPKADPGRQEAVGAVDRVAFRSRHRAPFTADRSWRRSACRSGAFAPARFISAATASSGIGTSSIRTFPRATPTTRIRPSPTILSEQGFAIRIRSAGKTAVRALDHSGFSQISFTGEYPIGFVEYRDAASPVSVSLEAFSPFIPLDPHDSHLPATILRYTVKNESKVKVECELAGWLQNAVCPVSEQTFDGSRVNSIVRGQDLVLLNCSVTPAAMPEKPKRPTIVFADFEGKDFAPWKVEGEAFGKAPARERGATPSISPASKARAWPTPGPARMSPRES